MPYASFRDPSGFVLSRGGRIFRVVRQDDARDLFQFLDSLPGRGLIEQGEFIPSRYAAAPDRDRILHEAHDRISGWEGTATVIEHDSVWFASYPYEWPSAMLRDAARLTLDMAAGLLAHGYGLKDATPRNILFRGPEAVFVDAMSIEKRDPRDPLWRPLNQFLQTFLYPLLLEQATGAPAHESLLAQREGLTAAGAYGRLSWPQRLLSLKRLRWISIPHWLSRGRKPLEPARYSPDAVGRDEELATVTMRSTLGSLRDAVASGEPAMGSDWELYSTHCHYDGASRKAKQLFVREALSRFDNGRVLDVGANDGEYSVLAASCGHDVVACDQDGVCMGSLWSRARQDGLAILPLVVNIANPTPAMGWGNRETRSFLTRAEDARFDCVLMLALLHHLAVTERVPVAFILDLVAKLTRQWAVIEWISPEDGHYQMLLRGRQRLHMNDTQEAFEKACEPRFETVRKVPLMDGRRWLYLLAVRES